MAACRASDPGSVTWSRQAPRVWRSVLRWFARRRRRRFRPCRPPMVAAGGHSPSPSEGGRRQRPADRRVDHCLPPRLPPLPRLECRRGPREMQLPWVAAPRTGRAPCLQACGQLPIRAPQRARHSPGRPSRRKMYRQCSLVPVASLLAGPASQGTPLPGQEEGSGSGQGHRPAAVCPVWQRPVVVLRAWARLALAVGRPPSSCRATAAPGLASSGAEALRLHRGGGPPRVC